jgi:protein-L-isoaspartate(D-aspartate) O-methyltransferase
MNIEQARFNMVEQQIRTWDVLDQDVLDALYVVKREDYVPEAHRALAFSDLEIPLGDGESMMQPKMEARILQELAIRKSDRVLEVGTGSGYLTALLAYRASHVYSVEINPRLKLFGAGNLRRNGVINATVEQGDAARGWPKHAPYDVVVLTGSVPIIPRALADQMRAGARLFAVVGDPPVMSAKLVTCVSGGTYNAVDLFETVLRPLQNCEQPERFEF